MTRELFQVSLETQKKSNTIYYKCNPFFCLWFMGLLHWQESVVLSTTAVAAGGRVARFDLVRLSSSKALTGKVCQYHGNSSRGEGEGFSVWLGLCFDIKAITACAGASVAMGAGTMEYFIMALCVSACFTVSPPTVRIIARIPLSRLSLVPPAGIK